MLQPIEIKTQKYRQLAYTAIKEALLAGELAAGQLLIEEHLAAVFKISRTPVREALAILEHERLIGPQGNRGLAPRVLTRQEFIEVFTANEAIEPVLARRAAYLATEEELQEMAAGFERGRRHIAEADFVRFLANRRHFHRILGMAAQNAPLADFLLRNDERADIYLIACDARMDRETMEASIREHEAIHAAIIRRDPDEAARLTIYHAQSIRGQMEDFFREE